MISNSFFEKRNSVFKFYVNRPYLSLLICMLFTAFLLYWQYIFGDKTFVFFDSVGGDTHHGYVPTYNFFASAIKNGELSSYTFQCGFGNSIFSLISVVADPFSMIGVLVGIIFGNQYIADSIIYILILKHICAGLLCLYFLNGFNFSKSASMISAYIYAFSGYIMTLGEHYFFAVSPVYYIILLIMLERTIKGEHEIKNWIGLIVIVVLVSVNNLVTAYEMLLGAGFYTLFRVIYIYGKDVKKIMQRLGISLAFVICGVCISSFILFPVMNKVAGSDRLIHLNDYFSLNKFDNIKSAVLKLFSNNLEGTPDSWYGGVGQFAYYSNCFPCFFTVMLVPVTAQFIWRTFKKDLPVRKKVFRMIPIGVIAFAVVDKFIPYMFSCFVPSNYHSYVYVFLPLYAILFAEVIDNIKLGNFSRKVNYSIMIVSLAVIAWGGISSYNEGSKFTLIWMIFSALLLTVGCFAMDVLFLSSGESVRSISQKQIGNVTSIALFAVFTLNLFGENFITVNYGRNPISKEQEHAPMLINDVADSINTFEKNNFFRFESTYYDGIMMGYTYPLLFPIRSTGYYDSSLDNSVPEFYLKMFNYSNHNMCDYNVGCASFPNTIIEDILGIKYLLLTSDFQRSGWEKVKEYSEEGAYLYRNTDIDSAGLLFDSYITQEEADSMNFNERAIGMAERLIVDDLSQDLDNYAAKYSKESAAYYDNSALDVNSSFTYMCNINSIDLANNKYYFNADFEENSSSVTIPLNTKVINDNKKATQITYRLKSNDVYFVYFDADNTWKFIERFDSEAYGSETVYTFVIPQTASHVALCVNQPCTLDFSVSSKTVTASYTNKGIHLDNPGRGNVLNGTVKTEKNSLLYLPIPYDEYWNAYIDGEKVEILKANYAFIAIPISEGEHHVDFIYSNQTYNTFLKVSIVTFIVTNLFFIVYAIFDHKRKSVKRKPE